MLFNATFNNISVISWWSVLLVEESGEPGGNHRPVVSHWQTLSHNVVHLALIEIRTHEISGDRHEKTSKIRTVKSDFKFGFILQNGKTQVDMSLHMKT